MTQAYKSVVVSLGTEIDKDLLELVDSLKRDGKQISPWIKQAMRERINRGEKSED